MDVPTIIRDDLLATGDVGIDHILRHGDAWVVLYRVIKTGQRRVACYDSDGMEAQFDLVIDGEESALDDDGFIRGV